MTEVVIISVSVLVWNSVATAVDSVVVTVPVEDCVTVAVVVSETVVSEDGRGIPRLDPNPDLLNFDSEELTRGLCDKTRIVGGTVRIAGS